MAQSNLNSYNPNQFIVDYYTTYVYKRNSIPSFYEKSAMIYRQSWQTNNSLPIFQCADRLFFSNEGDHLTVLNYSTLPVQYGFLYVINGQIDTQDGSKLFFNQVLQIQFFGYYRLIVADYCSFTGQPLGHFAPADYFDVFDPSLQSNEVANASEIPKPDEKISNQTEQTKQQVSQAQQQTKQQQQQYDYSNNVGRGNNNHRYYSQRGRGRGQNRNDGGSRDLSEKYGTNKYVFNAQPSQSAPKYVPPTSQINQNNK